MNDDFNTRGALAALQDLVGAVHAHVDAHDRYDYRGLRAAIEALEHYGGTVLGLRLGVAQPTDVSLAEDLVELVLEVRAAEREAGNYERADDLRAELADLGVAVQDTDDGATFRLP
jgi:cysteinyl-tRNA synthetase